MKPKIELDYTKIAGVRVVNIDFGDYPDFTDAYIESAIYDRRGARSP